MLTEWKARESIRNSIHNSSSFIISYLQVSGGRRLASHQALVYAICYVKAAEEALESSFQSLEVVNVTYIGERYPIQKPVRGIHDI